MLTVTLPITAGNSNIFGQGIVRFSGATVACTPGMVEYASTTTATFTLPAIIATGAFVIQFDYQL